MNLRLIAVIPFLAMSFAACAVQPTESQEPISAEEHTDQASSAWIAPGTPTWSWGGAFQIDDCWDQRDMVGNGANWNQFSCPSGFHAVYSGRQLDPESRCGGQQWQCVSDGYSSSKSWVFGGMFQIDDCGRNNVGNFEWNSSLACPPGFVRKQSARVMAPESNCGASQYICEAAPGTTSSDWTFSQRRFGGTFQVDDCGQNNIRNAFSGGTFCPSGFSQVMYGRVKAAEGSQCGVNQFVCWAWAN